MEKIKMIITSILFYIRRDFLHIYDGDMMITPRTAHIQGVTGYFHENFTSLSNAITLTFISGPEGGFNISIDTGRNEKFSRSWANH